MLLQGNEGYGAQNQQRTEAFALKLEVKAQLTTNSRVVLPDFSVAPLLSHLCHCESSIMVCRTTAFSLHLISPSHLFNLPAMLYVFFPICKFPVVLSFNNCKVIPTPNSLSFSTPVKRFWDGCGHLQYKESMLTRPGCL